MSETLDGCTCGWAPEDACEIHHARSFHIRGERFSTVVHLTAQERNYVRRLYRETRTADGLTREKARNESALRARREISRRQVRTFLGLEG